MLNILIADDHPVVAEGIRRSLDSNWNVVGTARSMAECERMLHELKPDLLIFDIGMPQDVGNSHSMLTGSNALDSLPAWKQSLPSLRTLVFTFYGEPSVVRRALSAGADGVVLKTSPVERLVEGLTAIAGGGTYLCPATRKTLSEEGDATAEALTLRELEVLRLIADGLSEKMVADRLCLSYETVHSYAKLLRAKLGVNNTASLVRKALEQRLV